MAYGLDQMTAEERKGFLFVLGRQILKNARRQVPGVEIARS